MKIAFFDELEKGQNILIAGAGGGFDVFCGLPLFFWLKKAGKTVHLANLTFTDLGFCEGERPVPSVMRVLASTGGSREYFPEMHLACLLAAPTVTGVERKHLVCIGFGVDTYHGLCHAQFLEHVAALIESGGYLGAWSLTREMEEFGLCQKACEFVAERMPRRSSIVNSSILSAVNGWFGDQHASKRTEGSELFINPLMAIYWAFQFDQVARRNLYLDRIHDTATYSQLSIAIETFRLRCRRPNRGKTSKLTRET